MPGLIHRQGSSGVLGIVCNGCAIWYYLYHLENIKNTHGDVLLLHGCFSCFINLANDTKLQKASHILMWRLRFN